MATACDTHGAEATRARRGDASQRWNHACDLAINLLLLEQGFRLPESGLMDRSYAGLSAEQIYERLPTGDAAAPQAPAPWHGAADDAGADDAGIDGSGVLVVAP